MATQTGTVEEEFDVLIRSRYPVIYCVSYEEDRVASMLNVIATASQKQLFLWSVTEGFVDYKGTAIDKEALDPMAALNFVISHSRPAVFLLHNFHPFLEDPTIVQRMYDLKKHLNNVKKTCVLVSPVLKVPSELEKLITVVDFDLPSIDLLNAVLDEIIVTLADNPNVDTHLSDSQREQVLKSALGLTAWESENVFAKSLVQKKCFDPALIIQEKKQIIRKTEILEFFHPSENLESIGGLTHLKSWLQKRQRGFTERAKDYGLPVPKGVMLIGIQGCGKSLTAKAIASYWQLPLLRLDVGKLFTSLVGESEQNIRKAITTAESISPAILWIDEIEKGFAGVQSSTFSDAGTTSRVFASFITWLQEKEKPVFVIATANDVSQLPPELLRKGRFDEIFFVDLPSSDERLEIFKIHLTKRGRNHKKFKLKSLVQLSNGFSGAEIEQSIVSAMFEAFSEDREVKTEDIVTSLDETIPLSKLMKEKIAELRDWAHSRARFASQSEVLQQQPKEIEV